MDEWITVNDKLPECDKDYPFLSKNVLIFDGEDIGIGYFGYKSRDWYTNFEDIDTSNISHWLEIPEPPKE